MKRKFLIAAVLSMLVLASAATAFGQRAKRIVFARHATSKIVTGTMRGYSSKRNFVIRVRAGQTLRTEEIGNSNEITIFVASPSGEDVSDSDASCNNRREVSPTVAGDYSIQVVECKKADPWRGTFKFRVTVR